MSTPEGRIQLAVIKALQKAGVYCWRNNNGATYDPKINRYRSNPLAKKGIADIVGILPDGRHLEVEVKTKTGKLSPEQVMHGKRVRELGGTYIIARSVEDVKELL
jgi:hypothetical protein